MQTQLRTADQIIKDLAERRGLVTPVPAYFPLGVSFARQCVREAYLDAADLLADAGRQHADRPEVIAALRAVIDELARRAGE